MPKIAPRITTEWQRFDALSAAALYEMLRFRQQIFVVEQGSPYPDLDNLDQNGRHLLLRVEGVLAGYLRLLPPTGPAAMVLLGRVAVATELRRQGIGHRLMTEALSCCQEHYPRHPIGLGAQRYLLRFYRGFGFGETGAPYDDFGVPHIDMRKP